MAYLKMIFLFPRWDMLISRRVNLWEDFVVIVFFSGMLLRGFKLRTGEGLWILPRDVDILLEEKLKGMLYSRQICVLIHICIIICLNETYTIDIDLCIHIFGRWFQTCLSFTSESSQRCWPSSDLFIFSDGWCNHHRQGTKSGAYEKLVRIPTISEVKWEGP